MYLFRRVDNDQVVEVEFDTMMGQDAGGWITLPDGVDARRCVHLELDRDGRKAKSSTCSTVERPIISSSMGFTAHQIGEFEADRIKHGFSDIEFIPSADGYTYDVKCGSQEAKRRYAKHLGYEDFTSTQGARMGKEELEMAKQLVKERYE